MSFEKCLERLDVFSDSEEVADGIEGMHSEQHLYWPKEGSIHVRGLWDLALCLAEHGKRMQKRIKELEAQINE